MTTHDTIRQQIDATWADLLASIDGLDETALTTPGVTGTWTVKDILGHVSTWEESTMTHSQAEIDGNPVPDDEDWNMDRFNSEQSAAKAELSTTEIFQQLAETHERLLAWLPTIPADFLTEGNEVLVRLGQDTWDHYPEHAAAIRTWRESRPNP